MDEDQRTVWCGNLSDKVTEDILYELFLQGGPVQKVSIPKDRDGKQRTYGFVTFKHEISVPYALDLFDGTSLFDKVLSMKTRNNIKPQVQPSNNPRLRNDRQEPSQNLNNIYNLQNQMLISHLMADVSMYGLYAGQNMIMYPHPTQLNPYGNNQEDRRPQREHPYHRDRDRDRDRSDHKDRNDHRNRERHSSHRSNDNYSRNSDHKNSRRNNYRKK